MTDKDKFMYRILKYYIHQKFNILHDITQSESE
jgi:hypothetical protein